MVKCSQIIGMQKTLLIPPNWRRGNIERNIRICRLYESGKFTTEHIAKLHRLTPRAVQKIAAQGGVVRTIAESNVLIAALKAKHRVRR